ncbi:acyl carrier protein [Streptomyces triticisoli]|jgi:acyl carrier protein|uniref:acyl carrier protein n=1 Tax=Streptomyces triticisoli TaxID=2182797 RepID=UPI000DDB656C|nr:phosphopantetheine-binding protein [Streptomyces triticisoli]
MSSPDIAAEVRAFVVAEFLAGEDTSDLTGDYDLIDSGVIDSLGLVRLLSHITRAYRIPADDIEFAPDHFRTLDAVVAVIAAHSPAAAV